MSLFRLSAQLLLTLSLPVVCFSGSAKAADSNTLSQLRVTEITEDSHPFETLYCARQPIQVRFINELAEIVVEGESRMLRQTISASGARYIMPGDDSTELWNKGRQTTVTWSGQTLPVCAPAGEIILPYRASGNEPFWAITYDGWRATLARPGKPDLTQDARRSQTSETAQVLVVDNGADTWRLEVNDGLCFDDMSGMPHPQQATLHYQSTILQGCGGNPDRLLQGVTWHITNIGDQAANDATPAQIRFHADNTVTGTTGCNGFSGQYTLTGETLTLRNIGSTRKACPAELMTQENTLLRLLTSVSRFSFKTSEAKHILLLGDGFDIQAEVRID